MGICMSTTIKKPIRNTPPPPLQSPPPPKDLQDRTLVPESDPPLLSHINQTTTLKPQISHPSPPLLEEETVKEVLSSETPSSRPNFLKYHPPDQQKILRLPSFPKLEEKRNNAQFEEVSEVSDVCSLSESISTSVQSREYEEIPLPQPPRFIDRSPSKIRRKRSDSGEFYGRGESPVRRSEQWLGCGRTEIAGKSIYISKETANHSMPRQPQRSLSQNRGVMRDQGESSRRRSRSPAHSPIDVGVFRPAGICQSPSGRRIVRSTGRSPVKAPPESNKDEMWRGKESIEDPLVSLECFIFL